MFKKKNERKKHCKATLGTQTFGRTKEGGGVLDARRKEGGGVLDARRKEGGGVLDARRKEGEGC